ncbi:integrase catalytic domain-containing protein [Leptolinea tardivitalis]|nr:DDE-type integrase/transposase/recombinase [Leptolinea tardivitalis]GAP20625.1 transposase [Leptolinea tardivitalis]GAP21699.1 transposase [Leptolinea tardivitalis]GAP22743.1 transposase [Leptolinea tardivitalis]GAP22841.1 transposase [Leptolinea tardivitalis]GAP23013.1 transposase [Leptolinea tardivitalis]
MMSQQSKRELVETIRPRYQKGNKTEKARILDELVAITGYHRKYAIRVLGRTGKPRAKKKPGPRRIYQGEVVTALEYIWEICGQICSKRLKPFLPEIVKVLERNNEIHISPETKKLLLQMSRSSIDRCLSSRYDVRPHGLSTTKPGTLLKKSIPVRTYTPWNEERPGFMEIDLVAHCGDTAAGQFVNTLTCVDICTGWTECQAVFPRSRQTVLEAIVAMQERLPFDLLGLDSDNGSEFINEMLFQYCQFEKITFTRSRPYRKNDQAHVEQKNWSVVRHLVGYDRFDTLSGYNLLQSIYSDLSLYFNFFQPVLKLISKEYVDGRIIKLYDKAATPYQRVLGSDLIPFQIKANLTNLYVQLNPVTLRKSIDQKVHQLCTLSR